MSKQQGNNDKNKRMGIIATVLFHIVLIIVLVVAHLCYDPLQTPEEKQEEILFGGEFVALGDFDTPRDDAPGMEQVAQRADNTAVSGEDVTDAGDVGVSSTPIVKSDVESPMKVQEEPAPGPTAEEIAAEQERVRKQEERKKQIEQRMSFGKNKGTGQGTSGSPEGSVEASASGVPGVSGLEGYTLSSWGKANSPVEGVVRISVRVNARGKVIKATYAGGSGSAARSLAVRKSCEQASLQSQFSVPKNTTTEGVGELTWRFEPKN